MSKFWGESSSDEESDFSEEEEVSEEFQPNSKYVDSDEDSGFEDDEQRVVKSAAQKRNDSLNTAADAVRDAMDADDFVALQKAFGTLQKEVEKAMKAERRKAMYEAHVGTLRAVAAFVQGVQDDKNAKKALSKTGVKAANALHKDLKTLCKAHEKAIAKYEGAHPGKPEDDDAWGRYGDARHADDAEADADADADAGGDDDDDDDDDKAAKKGKPRKNKWMMSDSDSDDDDAAARKRRDRLERKREAARAGQAQDSDDDDDADDDDADADEAAAPVVDEWAGEWDDARVNRRAHELLAKRGARGTDRSQQAANWQRLLGKCEGLSPRTELLVLSHLVPALFDSTTLMGSALRRELWNNSVTHTQRMLDLVRHHADLSLVGDGDATTVDSTLFTIGSRGARRERALLGAALLDDGGEFIGDDSDESDDGPAASAAEDKSDAASVVSSVAESFGGQVDTGATAGAELAPLVIAGNFGALVERLDREWLKAVRKAEPSKQSYVERLRDEPRLLALADAVFAYYTAPGGIAAPRRATVLAALRIEHLYHRRFDAALLARLHAALGDSEPAPYTSVWMAGDHTARLNAASEYVFAHGDERLKTRALLALVYHAAHNGRYDEARDTLLMSYTQETIHHADIGTQVLFNRAMARLGLAAFERGLLHEAHSCLSELYGAGRVRELLAQGGTSRYVERTVDQERAEQERQVPYHMWISLELTEAVHLVSALLLEVPNMAKDELEGKRRVISRALRRQMDYSERQVFSGPPEAARDHALFAARALKLGDWKSCQRYIEAMGAWELFSDPDAVRVMLRRVVQREALRTYLLRYASAYDSLSLASLARQFELSEAETHALASRMIALGEVAGAWDQPTATLGLAGVEPSRLQHLALQFAERAASFVENNERLFDARTGGSAFHDAELEKQRERERLGGPRARGKPARSGGRVRRQKQGHMEKRQARQQRKQ